MHAAALQSRKVTERFGKGNKSAFVFHDEGASWPAELDDIDGWFSTIGILVTDILRERPTSQEALDYYI